MPSPSGKMQWRAPVGITDSMLAPLSMRTRATASCPFNAATCNGVLEALEPNVNSLIDKYLDHRAESIPGSEVQPCFPVLVVAVSGGGRRQ
jgi:hypothetical protein